MKKLILCLVFLIPSIHMMADVDMVMLPNTVIESYDFKEDTITITTKRTLKNNGGALLELSYKHNNKTSIIQDKFFTDVTFDPRIVSYVTYLKEFRGGKNSIWIITINVMSVRISGEWKNVQEGQWIMTVSSDGERSIFLEYTIDGKARRIIYEGKPLFGPAVGE